MKKIVMDTNKEHFSEMFDVSHDSYKSFVKGAMNYIMQEAKKELDKGGEKARKEGIDIIPFIETYINEHALENGIDITKPNHCLVLGYIIFNLKDNVEQMEKKAMLMRSLSGIMEIKEIMDTLQKEDVKSSDDEKERILN